MTLWAGGHHCKIKSNPPPCPHGQQPSTNLNWLFRVSCTSSIAQNLAIRLIVRLIAGQFERQSGDHTARAWDRLIVIGQTDLATERLTERATYTNRVSVRLIDSSSGRTTATLRATDWLWAVCGMLASALIWLIDSVECRPTVHTN